MSRILEKAFDASKKIIRSIFKGAPHLLTTSDLNRQMEAFKYQMDEIENRTGITSDMTINYSVTPSELTVRCGYSFIRFKGCSFNPTETVLTTNFTKSAPQVYLCLTADTEVVTYDSDPTHEIAGAKFEDGTSMEAANQLRYKGEKLQLVHGLSSVDNLIGIIAKFTLSDTGNVVVFKNIIGENESFGMNVNDVIQDFNYNATGRLRNGVTYDEAFSILENRFTHFGNAWQNLVKSDLSGGEVSLNSSFRVQNGVMELTLDESVIPIRVGVSHYRIGNFPAISKPTLLKLFQNKSINPTSLIEGAVIETPWIPYGDFGCFPLYGKDTVQTSYGTARVAIILEYGNGDNSVITDIYLGAYVTSAMITTSEGVDFKGAAAVWTALDVLGQNIYLHRSISSIPLFGSY